MSSWVKASASAVGRRPCYETAASLALEIGCGSRLAIPLGSHVSCHLQTLLFRDVGKNLRGIVEIPLRLVTVPFYDEPPGFFARFMKTPIRGTGNGSMRMRKLLRRSDRPLVSGEKIRVNRDQDKVAAREDRAAVQMMVEGKQRTLASRKNFFPGQGFLGRR